MAENEDQLNSLEISLVDSIAANELGGVIGDISEIGLDALLNDGVLKEIPVFGTVTRLYHAGVSIRDRLFLRKVLSFLTEFSDIDDKQRLRFVEQLVENAGTRARAGAALLLLLERLDDIDKPQIIGRLYRAKLEDRISYEELRRFCMIVERSHLPDLINLSQLPAGENVDSLAAPYLQALGLASVTVEDLGNLDGTGAHMLYELNEFGHRFVTVAFLE